MAIPATSQKSKADSTIPTIPEFAQLLDEVPTEEPTGFVLSPCKLHGPGKHSDSRRAGRVITAIGKRAGILINATKLASAHDLRRSFGQQLTDAGVTIRDLQAIIRHRHISTTEKYYLKQIAVEKAQRIADKLGYAAPDRTQVSEETEITQVIAK